MGIIWDDNQRFVLTGPFDKEMPNYYIIIKDIEYWLNNEESIISWMDNNLSRGKQHYQGMVLTIEEEKDVMMFMLRWS